MKKNLFFFAVITLLTYNGGAIFSQFVRVTPEVKSDHLLKVKVREQKDNYLVTLSDIKKAYGWQIELDKSVIAEQQNFRELIWNDHYPYAKVVKKSEILTNKKGLPKVLKIKIPKDKINSTYFYFDYPTMIMDGGFYFTVDLSSFVKSAKSKKPKALNN